MSGLPVHFLHVRRDGHGIFWSRSGSLCILRSRMPGFAGSLATCLSPEFDRERVQDNPGYHRFPSLIIIFSFCNLANLGYRISHFFDIFPDFCVSVRHPGWASSVLKKWNSAGGQSLGKGQQFVSVQAIWKSSISMKQSLSIIEGSLEVKLPTIWTVEKQR